VTTEQRRDNNDLMHVTSVLTLSDVKSSDAGVYQCVASNVVAAVYSAPAVVTVSGNCHSPYKHCQGVQCCWMGWETGMYVNIETLKVRAVHMVYHDSMVAACCFQCGFIAGFSRFGNSNF